MATRLVIYDGDCGVCTHIVDALARADRSGILRFVAGQSLEKLPQGVDAPLIEKTIIVIDPATGKRWTRADAIAEILRTISRFGVVVFFLKLPFFRPIANYLYDQIAARRERISRLLGLDVCAPKAPPSR